MTSNSNPPDRTRSRAINAGFTFLSALLLILLNLICYGRTLGGYFLADDYVHVAYLADVFNGHAGRLLENFTGNWMHAWGTQFYRPFISLTLAFDYMVGNGGALAFHLSNTIFHLLSGFLLFLIARQLLSEFSTKQQNAGALAAALLFTVCPLHTEVVSWIIGRVDGVCLVFFLSAFYFYLGWRKEKQVLLLSGSLISFALSLLSKEMALTLPPLVVLAAFTFSSAGNLKERLIQSLKESASFWGVLALYLGVRIMALGTLCGGYGGSVGEGLSGSLLTRFASAAKILFPFNLELISPFNRLVGQLSFLYRFSLLFVVAQFFITGISRKQLKLMAFCIAWFILALLPAYSVFNITDSLMCSRFAYFATVPFSLLLALLISPVFDLSGRAKVSVWLERVSIVLSIAFVFVFAQITIKNNSAWVQAGAQVREFRQALAEACIKLPQHEQLVLLNTPQRLAGAHMIYNGAMLQVLLSKPLSRPPIADRVLSFEPPTYGDADLINARRLRRLVAEHPQYQYCYWDMVDRRLVRLQFESRPCHLQYDLQGLNKAINDGSMGTSPSILSPQLNLNALSCDFVICTVRLSATNEAQGAKVPVKRPALLTLFWTSSNFPSFSPGRCLSLPAQVDGKEHVYYFAVSEHKSWLAGEKIDQLRLQLPDLACGQAGMQKTVSFGGMQIVSAEKLMPQLAPVPGQLAQGADGIDRLVTDRFEIYCDAGKIPGCTSLALELSRPNCWFEHYAGTYRESQFSSQCPRRFSRQGQAGRFAFKRADFTQPAYYQLRAFALDKNGKIIGFASDPVNLQID